MKILPNTWIPEREHRTDSAPKCETSRDEGLLSLFWTPGFPETSSALQHLMCLAVDNLASSPEIVQLDERGSGPELGTCKASVSCCTGWRKQCSQPLWLGVAIWHEEFNGLNLTPLYLWVLPHSQGNVFNWPPFRFFAQRAPAPCSSRLQAHVSSLATSSCELCYPVKIKHLSK